MPRVDCKRFRVVWGALALVLCSVEAGAQTEPATFYKGKTISIVVGFGPGGGYDLYARLLARTLGKHIAGQPAIVVQNMPGAGGLRAANYVYANAPKDGTVIAGVSQSAALFQQLGGKGALYDATLLQWLGRAASSNNVVYTWSASGVRSIADAKTRDVTMAGSGALSDADMYPKVLNALIGTRFRIINGYSGTNDSNLAMERGEVDGRGGGAYSSLVSTHSPWLGDKTISILTQIGFEREPDLPAVPRLLDLVADDEDKQIAALVTLPVAIGYNYWMAPETPRERVETLRQAFADAMRDPDLLAEAKSQSLDIRWESGARLEEMTRNAAQTPRPIVERAARILGWGD